MTEILSQHNEIPESESNIDGIYDITTIDELEEVQFESLDPDRLFRMSQEIVGGGAVDRLLDRLASVKAEAEGELIKVQALMRPLVKIQTQYSAEINEIVAQIGLVGAAVGAASETGEGIAELATKLIAVNKQLADISSNIDVHKADETRHVSRIEQCDQSMNDVVKYRESCIVDLAAAKQLNASMRSKPGLGMLVPESLLISPDQKLPSENHYPRLLGETVGKIVNYHLPESVTDYSPPEIEKIADPPKREALSPAPLNITNGSMRLPRFRR